MYKLLQIINSWYEENLLNLANKLPSLLQLLFIAQNSQFNLSNFQFFTMLPINKVFPLNPNEWCQK
jgi:hypothetical protein